LRIKLGICPAKTFKITTEQENKRNLERVVTEKAIIKSLNQKDCQRNIENLQQLEDEILINKALGLINLDFCIDNNIEFGDLAKAINRQRK